MDLAALIARLAAFPRLPLAHYPTPLEPAERLTAQVRAGGRLAPALWFKRDDGIGPAMGGNKARKLEFLMAQAQARRALKVVTFGGLQSNHARMTAAVARKLGMEPHLFFFERRPREMMGNLLLDSLFGAKLHFIPMGGGGQMSLKSASRMVRLLSWALVGPSYFIPVGGHTALGGLGYVACATEIHAQVMSLGLRSATVITAVGTGGTLAGLLAGFKLLDSPICVLGIDVGKLWQGFADSIAHLAGEICALLGERHPFTRSDVPLLEERYVGPRYGVPSPEGSAALRRVAECEGIILDPVYTGKAMAGALDLVRRGWFAPGEAVIFLHTGGAPGLFAFPEPVCIDDAVSSQLPRKRADGRDAG